MDMKKAEAIILSASGLEWQEWEKIAEMVERKFERAKAKAKFTIEEATHAVQTLSAELPRG